MQPGPTQTARSVKGLDRRQVSFVNQRHISEENLNQAITRVINAYAQLPLQRVWGSGKDTYWYLSATPELFAAAVRRFKPPTRKSAPR